MGDLADLYNGAIAPTEPNLVEAKLHDSAEGPTDEVRCRIPSIDPDVATDPMAFMPFVTGDGVFYPKVGDRALVAFPDEGPPVIVWWRPKAGTPDHSF